MKKTIYLLLALAFPVNIHAFDLTGVAAKDMKAQVESVSLPEPLPEPVVLADKMMREYADVYMNVRRDPAGTGIAAHHIYGKFDITVSRPSKDEFTVSAAIGAARERWSVKRTQGGNYILSGAGVAGQVIARGSGKYLISADVSGRDLGLKYMEVQVNRRHPGAYALRGLGLNLNADASGITGNYNTNNFSGKAAAVAISAALVLQEENFE